MIFGHQFYNASLRRYIVAFGNMFNEMTVSRVDSTGTRVQTIAVPITYGPKEKFLARIQTDPNLNRPVAVQLPAMSFEIASMNYDASRRISSVQQFVKGSSSVPSGVLRTYTPVPWNISFSLFIYVRNADDGAQILEQILPFFGPEWTNSIELVPSMGLKFDVPTVIESVTTEDAYEGDFITRRAMVYTLTFTMKAYFFGPVISSGPRNKLIRKIQIDFGIPKEDVNELDIPRQERLVITPGLLANGSPTSNSAASIPYLTIAANSNFGIASNTFFFSDGLKYNPVTGNDE